MKAHLLALLCVACCVSGARAETRVVMISIDR